MGYVMSVSSVLKIELCICMYVIKDLPSFPFPSIKSIFICNIRLTVSYSFKKSFLIPSLLQVCLPTVSYYSFPDFRNLLLFPINSFPFRFHFNMPKVLLLKKKKKKKKSIFVHSSIIPIPLLIPI